MAVKLVGSLGVTRATLGKKLWKREVLDYRVVPTKSQLDLKAIAEGD